LPIDDIAAALNEPLPKQVFLVGSANAFVSNVGGFFGVGSRRILGIGLPFLSMLTIPEFRAVLAHEFAHYYGGDTRLGPLVYRAQGGRARKSGQHGVQSWGLMI
jgi:Zn-dependent protease with chaperone function